MYSVLLAFYEYVIWDADFFKANRTLEKTRLSLRLFSIGDFMGSSFSETIE
jgi:hypothetical protein